MTEARALHTTAPESTMDPVALALVAGELCHLPAVASQDWAEQAADAMTGIDRWCRIAVMIAHADETGRLSSIEAVGVRSTVDESRRMSDPKGDLVSARVKLGRFTDLGFPINRDAFKRGLSANLDDLTSWRDGPIGRVWDTAGIDRLLLGIAPISSESGGRCIITLAALGPAMERSARADPRTLGALMILLNRRALLALPAGEEINWLTDREQDVLSRLTLGRSVREIADELGRSPHTVHDHVKSLHRKLKASSRGELVARALGHTSEHTPAIDPIVIERLRAATQIEPTPGIARRVAQP
ncbi:MAG: response regulator transcription factor [Phycisphaerales bacterium]